jgi:hypothetical protein
VTICKKKAPGAWGLSIWLYRAVREIRGGITAANRLTL